ncbi:lysophospholipid acyltransferase family protein [Pseudooceanicola sp.]|uniref:lysophospholipid acyltransferase family protein n=1 Tax=Pseudooceanicola sp. TaxID=1914328 RepID=UPI002606F746|nr:lysophospholipid acyltransferase family protein [Pseudooceanicola sp.]MDF1855320.1 lysophospholipid acyltransferase family protein [Pseudooceanicola sp.]
MRRGPLQYIASILYIFLFYLMMPIYGLLYLPWAIVSRDGALQALHAYTRAVRWSARWMIGIRTEIRGTVPTGEVLICAKHQSLLDVMLIFNAVPKPKFIMKSILKYAPVLGWYAMRIGTITVNRGRRAEAIREMMDGVKAGVYQGGQLIIYPQGTRVPPGQHEPYKVGAAVLYGEMNQTCIPVATNVGLFWPKRSLLRKPGLAVIEFLEPIPPGLPRRKFLELLEARIEAGSNALMREGGFDPDAVPDHDRGA